MAHLIKNILILISFLVLFELYSFSVVKRQTTSAISDGTYRDRLKERKRLYEIFNYNVSGTTHESEHVVGVAVLLNLVSNITDRYSGIGKEVQDSAPAYYEYAPLHRKHVGSGSGTAASNYRKKIWDFIMLGKIGLAMIECQKEYLKLAEFKNYIGTIEEKVATNSFNHMVKQNPTFYYLDLSLRKIPLKLTQLEQIDVYLSRQEILTGQVPTLDDRKKAALFLGISI